MKKWTMAAMVLALVALAGCGTVGQVLAPLGDPQGLMDGLGIGTEMAHEKEVVVGITYTWDRESGWTSHAPGIIAGTKDTWLWGTCEYIIPDDPAEKAYWKCEKLAKFVREVTP